MRIRITVLAASATLLFTTPIRAEDDKPAADAANDKAGLFAKLDADKDGQLTASEAGQEHRRLFDRLMRNADKNADGTLSQEEFVAGLQSGEAGRNRGDRPEGPPGDRPRRAGGNRPDGAPGEARRGGGRFGQMAERLRELDQNKDGKIALDEVPEERQQMFEMMLDRFDKNGDDAMDTSELAEAARELGPGRPDGPGGRPEGPPGPPPVVAALDANSDGTLSAEEIDGASGALKKLDKNGDGKLTREELMPPPPGGGRTFSREGGPDVQVNPEQLARRLMNGDKNGDGKLQMEELPERMQERFDRMDTNGDGALEGDEVKSAAERLQRRLQSNDGAATNGSDETVKPAKMKTKADKKPKKDKKKPAATDA